MPQFQIKLFTQTFAVVSNNFTSIEESAIVQASDQENQRPLSQKSGNHHGQARQRLESDRIDRSPAISSSQDRSENKALKSIDVTTNALNQLNGHGESADQASQSGTYEGGLSGNMESVGSKLKANRDHCNFCKKGGNLVLCDSCPRAFHKKCLRIKDKELPAGDWACPNCQAAAEKKRSLDDEKRKKQEERDRQAEIKRRLKEEEDRVKIDEIERKREEKRKEKERLDDQKRVQREQLEEQKKTEREQQAEVRRLKDEELAEARRVREAAFAEARAKKEAELVEQKKIREENLAEQKRKREEEAAESKKKRDEIIAAQAEARRLRDAAAADAKNKALAQRIEQQKQKQGSQQSQSSADAITAQEEAKKDSATKSFPLRRAEEKTEAEKAKEARSRELKNQFKVFQRFYPELVEKNSIKYPIEDQFITLLPILHGADIFPKKPETKEMLVDGPTFERLLYVWEFFNNFSEYFNLAPFKLEELQGALAFGVDAKQQVFEVPQSEQDDEDNEPDWEDQISNKTVFEQGFGLLNSLHLSSIECFFTEIRVALEDKTSSGAQGNEANKESDVSEDQLLNAVVKYFEKGESHHWTELIRMIFKSKRFTIHPVTASVEAICDTKLSSCLPDTYSTTLTYNEKLEVLETLVDGIHDLVSFKAFLNQRLEERSSYNKQKMDIYVEIKGFESRKQELIKENQESNILSNSEQIMNKIEDLRKQLDQANRVESKRIHQQIADLQNEKNKVMREMQKVEEQIEKRQTKIEKLNEQANKTSIKNQALGKDADRNEYWFFKEDPSKLYVKKQYSAAQKHEVKDQENIEMVRKESSKATFAWSYYDEEGQFEKLLEACNLKGIRERRLQENLRKLRDRLKLKKTRKTKVPIAESLASGQVATIAGWTNDQPSVKLEDKIASPDEVDDKKMSESSESEDAEDEEEESKEEDRHVLFQNDNYQQAMINAVWYGKKMPSKRQVQMESRQVATRRGHQAAPSNLVKKPIEDLKPTLQVLKETTLGIESLYSDSGLALQREWDVKAIRDKVIANLEGVKTVQELGQLLLRLDQGFSQPHLLRYKNSKDEEFEEVEEEEEDNENSNSEEDEESEPEEEKEDQAMKEEGDSNVRIIQLKFFKYWPSKELRSSWRDYVFSEVQDNNLGALSIAVRIFERVNNEFLQRQIENQLKKQQKENRHFQAAAKVSNIPAPKVQQQQPVVSRATVKGQSYKQYFDSQEEEDSSDEDSVSNDGGKAIQKKGPRSVPQQSGQASRGRGRPRRIASSSSENEGNQQSDQEEEIQSNSSEDGEDQEDDDDDGRSWEDRCFMCRKAGSLLCCEGCSHVAHLTCIGLKKKPDGDWHCEDCLVKMTKRRTTRGQTTKHTPASNGHSHRSNSRNEGSRGRYR